MSDIFISYAREDLDRVALLAQALAKQGWGVFWDRTIPTGKTWRDFIGAKLDAARCVVVVWSQHSVKSGFVHEEADAGKERGILAPVLIDRVRLPLGFGGIQAADLSQWDGTSTASILEQLFADIGQLPGLERKRETERRDLEERKRVEAAEMARKRAEEEVRRKAAEEARRKAKEEKTARLEAEQEAQRREAEERAAKEEAKRVAAAQEAQRKVEEEKRARLRAKKEAQRREAEERAAKEEAKRVAAAEEAKRLADGEARRMAEAEARWMRKEEARRKAAPAPAKPVGTDVPSQPVRQTRGAVEVEQRLVVEIGFDTWVSESLTVSADSRRFAFVRKKSKFLGLSQRFVAVVDGREGDEYEAVDFGSLQFSTNGQRFGFIGKSERKWAFVADGRRGRLYDNVGVDNQVFSPDGERVAYAAKVGDKWMVVVDGQEGSRHDGIGKATPIFSPNSQRVAYDAMVGGKWIVVVDGEEVGRYDGTSEGTPILFSPNSQRVAYGAQVGDKWMVVVDGEEVGRYDGIMSGTPIFSPDSQHVVYVARVGDKWTTFLEGQERGEYDSLIDEPVFNEDGTWLAFTAQSGGNTVIVVNGHESALLGPSLRGSRIVFDDNNTIRALIVQGDRVYSIRARIK